MHTIARTAGSLLVSLLLSLPGAPLLHAQPAGGTTMSVDGANAQITYKLVHKAHTVVGTSKKPEGKARILPDGKVMVMVQVPVESFDSGNSNRDAHMKETVQAASHPTILLKATADGVTIPTTFPTTIDKTFKAELAFHNEKKVIDVPAHITFTSATAARVTASFQISLEGFKIERPSLLFVKVDDALKIEVDIAFKS